MQRDLDKQTQDYASDEPKPFLKKVGWIVGAVIVLLFAKGLGFLAGKTASTQFASGYSDGVKTSALAEGLKQAAAQLRPQLPLQIDSITRLTGVLTSADEITYLYTVSEDVSASDLPTLKAELQSVNERRVCSDPRTLSIIQMGGKMTYQYSMPSGDLFSTTIQSCTPS